MDEDVALGPEDSASQLLCNTGEHRFDVDRGVPLLYPASGRQPQSLGDLLSKRNFPDSAIGYLTDLDRSLALPKELPMIEGYIDGPAATPAVKGRTTVKGWVIDFRSCSRLRVDIHLDGRFVGSTENNIPARDVRDHFARIGFPAPVESRFAFELDTTDLRNGTHTISVIVRSESGSVYDLGQTSFEVANGN